MLEEGSGASGGRGRGRSGRGDGGGKGRPNPSLGFEARRGDGGRPVASTRIHCDSPRAGPARVPGAVDTADMLWFYLMPALHTACTG